MDYLDKYNPITSIFENYKIEENLSKEDKAFSTWKALLSAKRSHDGLFLVIGKLLKSVRDNKYYLTLDYDNFTQFLASEELSFSREKAYMCIKIYEYYVEYLQLNPEHIRKINISKLSMMVHVLKKIDNKEDVIKQIEKLSQLRHGDFVREIRKDTDKGKPTVYWNEKLEKWIINYHQNITHLVDLGDYACNE
jgi:hypothetical protein